MLQSLPQPVGVRIREAIAGKHLLQLRYKNQTRVVEPHDFGVRHGVEWLLVYQLNSSEGAASHAVGWRLFDAGKIASLSVLEAKFDGSRRDSAHHHYAWDVLYARVD